jgi:hypothetical protein
MTCIHQIISRETSKIFSFCIIAAPPQPETMKFLCLHGMGTSSMIFEAELKKFTEALGYSNEYFFVDGFHPCGPAAGRRLQKGNGIEGSLNHF